MNPPVQPIDIKRDAQVLHELFEEQRATRQQVDRVRDSLEAHVRDEQGQYAEVLSRLSDVRTDVASLKTKMGFVAGGAGVAGGGLVAGFSRFFFG